MMQKFWDSAMALGPVEDEEDSHRYGHALKLFGCVFWFFFLFPLATCTHSF